MKTALFSLTLLIVSSYAYSYNGQGCSNPDSIAHIPFQYIASANAIYFYQLRQIETLHRMASQRQLQVDDLHGALTLCRTQTNIDRQIIENYQIQLGQLNQINASERKKTTILYGIISSYAAYKGVKFIISILSNEAPGN